MGVVDKLSGSLTNRDASPQVINNSSVERGRLKEAIGVIALANGDSIGSTLRFCQVPSNARLSELLVSCPDIGSTTTMDLGIYETTENGGAVVDADRFAAALSLKDGALVKSEALYESGVLTLADAEKPLWQMLGLSADPCKYYDIVGTLTGAADAAGTVVVQARYQE